MNELNEKKEEITDLIAQIEATKSFMIDVEFMKGVKNIEMLKDVIAERLRIPREEIGQRFDFEIIA